jgi:hypothetical protein
MTIPFTTYYHYGYFYWQVGIDENGETDIVQFSEKFGQIWEVSEEAKYKQRQFLESHAERILPELGEYVLDMYESNLKAKRTKKAA